MAVPPWDFILKQCAGARVAVLVSPYIKVNALKTLVGAIGPHAKLECITRWTPQDILVGASDLSCRKLIVDLGGSFRLHRRLHAKYYRFDERILIGSANLTTSGLNIAHIGNVEILCQPDPNFDGLTFENQLRQQSRVVSDDEFLLWEKCHVNQNQGVLNNGQSLGDSIEFWKPNVRNPEYLWKVYNGQGHQIISVTQRKLALLDIGALQIPQGISEAAFNNWIRVCLLASPFVDSVLSLQRQETDVAWESLGAQWRISKSQAARSISTIENWVSHFEQADFRASGL